MLRPEMVRFGLVKARVMWAFRCFYASDMDVARACSSLVWWGPFRFPAFWRQYVVCLGPSVFHPLLGASSRPHERVSPRASLAAIMKRPPFPYSQQRTHNFVCIAPQNFAQQHVSCLRCPLMECTCLQTPSSPTCGTDQCSPRPSAPPAPPEADKEGSMTATVMPAGAGVGQAQKKGGDFLCHCSMKGKNSFLMAPLKVRIQFFSCPSALSSVSRSKKSSRRLQCALWRTLSPLSAFCHGGKIPPARKQHALVGVICAKATLARVTGALQRYIVSLDFLPKNSLASGGAATLKAQHPAPHRPPHAGGQPAVA